MYVFYSRGGIKQDIFLHTHHLFCHMLKNINAGISLEWNVSYCQTLICISNVKKISHMIVLPGGCGK